MNIAHGDLIPRVEEVPHVLRLDSLRAAFDLNQRPTRAHSRWLRPSREMRNRVEQFAGE